MQDIYKILKEKGASIVGFADIHHLYPESQNQFHRGISIGISLTPRIIQKITNGPTKEYEREYINVNLQLDKLALFVTHNLENKGYKALPITTTTEKFSRDLVTQFSHKAVAVRAGLGWIGKCALLVTHQYGSAIRLTSVLTNAELPVHKHIYKSYCGDCAKCVELCPASAPLGSDWQENKSRDNFFNAHACMNMTRKWKKERGLKHSICGICINVCPWTQKYIKQK